MIVKFQEKRKRVCHCLEQAVFSDGASVQDGTACSKQWHTDSPCIAKVHFEEGLR